jgi:hypothetical protein
VPVAIRTFAGFCASPARSYQVELSSETWNFPVSVSVLVSASTVNRHESVPTSMFAVEIAVPPVVVPATGAAVMSPDPPEIVV